MALGTASAWLSARARSEHDGVLAVLRVGSQERLAYGSLDSEAVECRGYKTMFIKWPQDKSSIEAEPFCVVENASGVAVECLLFLLRAGSTTPRGGQRIDLIGRSSLELNAQDLNVVETDSIAFLSSLNDGLGSIELRLRRAEQRTATEERETQGSFSVNWSSTEALAKDLAEKGASFLLVRSECWSSDHGAVDCSETQGRGREDAAASAQGHRDQGNAATADPRAILAPAPARARGFHRASCVSPARAKATRGVRESTTGASAARAGTQSQAA